MDSFSEIYAKSLFLLCLHLNSMCFSGNNFLFDVLDEAL